MQADDANRRLSLLATRDGDCEDTPPTHQNSAAEEARLHNSQLDIAVEDWPRGVAGIRQEANVAKISFKLGPRLAPKATKTPHMISAPRFVSSSFVDSAASESFEKASATQTSREQDITAAPSPSMPSISAEEVQALRREVAMARAIAAKVDEATTLDENQLGPDHENDAATFLCANAKLPTDDDNRLGTDNEKPATATLQRGNEEPYTDHDKQFGPDDENAATALLLRANAKLSNDDGNQYGPDDEIAATATILRANAKLATDDTFSLRRTVNDPFPAKHDGHRERRRRRRRREDEDYDSDDGRKQSRRSRREKTARRRRHKRDADDADRLSEDSRRKRRHRHRASRRRGGSKRRRRDDGNYDGRL